MSQILANENHSHVRANYFRSECEVGARSLPSIATTVMLQRIDAIDTDFVSPPAK